MIEIQGRCRRRDTNAFVTSETVDLLAEKMIGIVADRRMTKMHRYLGEHAGTPRVFAGLRVWYGGYGGPTNVRKGQSASIALASRQRQFESVGFGVGVDSETEAHVRDRYHHPEMQFLRQRRNITFVELDGSPGEPARDDQIRIEHWNENGVGQETIVVFDDVDPVQEIDRDLKGDRERYVHMDDEFCVEHVCHIEEPGHVYEPRDCALRPATLAENLTVLAARAKLKEAQGAEVSRG